MTNSTSALHCIAPEQVDDSDVSSYVAGERRPGFVAHLGQCSFCQAEVAQSARIEALLASGLGRKPIAARVACPPAQNLADFAFGLLSTSEKRPIQAHLKSCLYCPAELGWLQAELNEEALPLVAKEKTGEKLRRIWATLIPALPQLVPVRGEGGRAQEYRIEPDITLVVRVQPVLGRKDRLTVDGSIVRDNQPPDEFGTAPVQLWRDDQVIASENLEEGHFFFDDIPALPATPLNLEISLDGKILAVANVRFEEN